MSGTMRTHNESSPLEVDSGTGTAPVLDPARASGK